MRTPTFLLLALAIPSLAAAKLPDVSGPGPYDVGHTTITFTKNSETTGQPRPLATDVWYPAVAGTGTADNRGVLAEATVRKGRWPLVIFSHGLCGFPRQSLFFTEALARWGFVVAAVPHPGGQITDGFTGGALTCATTIQDSFANRVADIQFAIGALLDEAKRPGGPLDPLRVDPTSRSRR